MTQRFLEVASGAIILLLAVGYAVFMWMRVDPPRDNDSYNLNAEFFNVGGLQKGADVMVNGIKVGKVSLVELDETTFTAKVAISLKQQVKLPSDTTIAIVGDGLSGEKHIRLEVGTAKQMLEPGGSFLKVADYESIEDKVSKIIFNTDKSLE